MLHDGLLYKYIISLMCVYMRISHDVLFYTLFSSGVNDMLYAISIPGAIFWPLGLVLIIEKYGEVLWVTLMCRAT